jgi:integrase
MSDMKTKEDGQLDKKTPALSSGLDNVVRGLNFETRGGKFIARWREADGKRCGRSFDSVKDRDAFAREWVKARAARGRSVPILPAKHLDMWAKFKALTGDADPLDVARGWLEWRASRGLSMSVEEACGRLFAIRERRMLSRDSITHTQLHMARFCAVHGRSKLADVTADDIRAWLAALPHEAYTIRHHLKSVGILFRTAVKERWLDFNPASSVEGPRVISKERSVLSPQDAFLLFSKNAGLPCIGRLALEAFAGLRTSSACRLRFKEDVRLDEGIVMPAKEHKLGERQFVQGFTNVWAWLRACPPSGWLPLTKRQWDIEKALAFERASVENKGNCLRHSFATYDLALNGNAALTATKLTHHNVGMLYRHYAGKATKAEAREYFAIAPSA